MAEPPLQPRSQAHLKRSKSSWFLACLEGSRRLGPLYAGSSPENPLSRMLEELAASKFGFWVVAWIIALADSTFLLEPGKFVFTVSRTTRPELRASSAPFTVMNRELVFAIYSVPFRLFLITSISAPNQTLQKTFRRLSNINRRERRAWSLLLVSAGAMALLVAGPIISAVWGVQYSIILLLPTLYALGIAASVLIWNERRRFGLSNAMAVKISAELMLCPVCLINVFKRIALAQGWQESDRTEQAQTALRTDRRTDGNLPKDILETIVVEAIYKHRFLRDIAELRHADSRRVAESDGSVGLARTAYIKAMIDVHARQTVLSTLLGVLGYVPTMPAD
ncbi:hypothetical protein JQ563_32220 [Bradyrhizobium liaoningense]|nr:transcriptional repressor TraM [Bradyrhizobium liaoningense]MBR0945721.1 hypothetical protein [Bradyrhizobium liaoningense]